MEVSNYTLHPVRAATFLQATVPTRTLMQANKDIFCVWGVIRQLTQFLWWFPVAYVSTVGDASSINDVTGVTPSPPAVQREAEIRRMRREERRMRREERERRQRERELRREGNDDDDDDDDNGGDDDDDDDGDDDDDDNERERIQNERERAEEIPVCRGAADWQCCDVQEFVHTDRATYCGCSDNFPT